MSDQTCSYQPELLPEVVYPDRPGWVNLYNAAWKTAFDNIEYPDLPGWKPQLTCMPGMGRIWQWDSCFMTFFARFSNGALPGMNNLDNLYRLQREDGYMSMAYQIATGQATWDRINPPLLAWSEWQYYQATGDASRFEAVLPKLAAFFDWLKANRTRNTGLYWFEDSGSSGMDNSPRGGYHAEAQRGSDVAHIDLACQQALSALYIAKIARHVGRDSLADRFENEYEPLKERINRLHWCEAKGIYFDLFIRNDPSYRCNFLNHKTLAAFWPMVSQVADMEQTKRLIEHILGFCFDAATPSAGSSRTKNRTG
jgi:glycogen debranching enzyme